MKQDYLFQIKEYYDKICALTGSDNPSILEYYVKQILELIAKLNNGNDKFEFDESYRTSSIISAESRETSRPRV